MRTKKEFDEGHIENAVNIDLESQDIYGILKSLDKNKYYLVYCEKGVRSEEAVVIMHKLKFKNLFHLPAGYIGWEKYNKISGKSPK